MKNVVDLRTSVISGDVEPGSNLISLLNVRMLDAPERCRESLTRIQGFMVLQVAEDIGKDGA